MGSGLKLAVSATGDSDNILIVMMLRGGCDGLSLFPPLSGNDRSIYETARPRLQIPLSGENAALDLDGQFGLHPAAAPLKPLFDDGKLAIVRAVGNLATPSRSHFDALTYVETGVAAQKGATEGWLTRYFATLDNLPTSIIIPSLSASSYTPTSFLGDPYVLTMDDPESFNLSNAHWAWNNRSLEALPSLYGGSSSLELAGAHAVTALEVMAEKDFSDYSPGGGAVYPQSYLGSQLKMLAQIVKDSELGLRVASLDFGGWDTHNGQDNADFTGYFSTQKVAPLSLSLAAFMADLGATPGLLDRVTLVVQTEFGRRLTENADTGTDHGYGSDLLLLGGAVNGGKFYGNWRGLENEALFLGEDIMATTDFRDVLSEVIIRRQGNPNLAQIFPGYSNYKPLGVMQGVDLSLATPLDHIFADGFEDMT